MNTYRGWRLLSELPGVSFQKRNIRVLRHGIHVGRLLGAKKVKITGCQVWWIGLIGVTAAIWNPEFVSRSDGVEWGRESSCCWHTQQTTTNQAVFLEFLALAGNEAHHCAVQCSFFFTFAQGSVLHGPGFCNSLLKNFLYYHCYVISLTKVLRKSIFLHAWYL